MVKPELHYKVFLKANHKDCINDPQLEIILVNTNVRLMLDSSDMLTKPNLLDIKL